MIANDGMRREIEFGPVALVTFERGEKVKTRYTFELASKQEEYDYMEKGKKNRTLAIEFIE